MCLRDVCHFLKFKSQEYIFDEINKKCKNPEKDIQYLSKFATPKYVQYNKVDNAQMQNTS